MNKVVIDALCVKFELINKDKICTVLLRWAMLMTLEFLARRRSPLIEEPETDSTVIPLLCRKCPNWIIKWQLGDQGGLRKH